MVLKYSEPVIATSQLLPNYDEGEGKDDDDNDDDESAVAPAAKRPRTKNCK